MAGYTKQLSTRLNIKNESLKNKEIKAKNLQAKLQKNLLISNYSILSKNCCLWNFWDYANLMGGGGGG